MCTLHQEVVVAYHGLPSGVGGTVDDHIFTNDVVVTDNQFRALTDKGKVLRQRAKHGTLVHFVVIAHLRTVKNAHEREDNAVVANLHFVLNIDKREYLAAVSDLGLRRDHGLFTNFTCHNEL